MTRHQPLQPCSRDRCFATRLQLVADGLDLGHLAGLALQLQLPGRQRLLQLPHPLLQVAV